MVFRPVINSRMVSTHSKSSSLLASIKVLKPIFFLLCCLPAGLLCYEFIFNQLGTNPIEKIIRDTGLWSYRFLILTLLISVLREQFRLVQLFFLRRLFGLFSFFYALLHFLAYIILDQYFDWLEIWLDIKDKPFISSGLLAFLLLMLLAISSNNKAMDFLGALQWQRLHRLVYLIGICAILHYYWMVKLVDINTFIYLVILTILLLYRLPFIRKIKWFS